MPPDNQNRGRFGLEQGTAVCRTGPSHPTMIGTMKLMTVITGDSKYLDVGQDLTRQGKETDVTMGYLFEQAEARGEARGISIGEARGEARGISIGEALGRNVEREAIRKEMARKDAEIAELRRKLADFQAKQNTKIQRTIG